MTGVRGDVRLSWLEALKEMDDLRVWIKGLMAAVIHGAAITVTAVIVDPSAFAASRSGLGRLGAVAGISAIFGAAGYLAQSPIPGKR